MSRGAQIRLPPGVDPMLPVRMLQLIISFSLAFMQRHVNHMVSHTRDEACSTQQNNHMVAYVTLLWLFAFGLHPESDFAREVILALYMGLRPKSLTTKKSHNLCTQILDQIQTKRHHEGFVCPNGCLIGFPKTVPYKIRFDPKDLKSWRYSWRCFHNDKCPHVWVENKWIDTRTENEPDRALLDIHAEMYDLDEFPVPDSVIAPPSASSEPSVAYHFDPATGYIRLRDSHPSTARASTSSSNQPRGPPQDARYLASARNTNPHGAAGRSDRASSRPQQPSNAASGRSNANDDEIHDSRDRPNVNNTASSSGASGGGGSGGGGRRNGNNNNNNGRRSNRDNNRRSNRDHDSDDDVDITDNAAQDDSSTHRLAFPAPVTQRRSATTSTSRSSGLPYAGDFTIHADPNHPNYDAINAIPELTTSEAIEQCLMRDYDGKELTIAAVCSDQTKNADTVRTNTISQYINLANTPSAQNLEGIDALTDDHAPLSHPVLPFLDVLIPTPVHLAAFASCAVSALGLPSH